MVKCNIRMTGGTPVAQTINFHEPLCSLLCHNPNCCPASPRSYSWHVAVYLGCPTMNAMGKPFHPQAEAWFCGRLFVKVSLHHSEHGAVKYQADKSRYQIVINGGLWQEHKHYSITLDHYQSPNVQSLDQSLTSPDFGDRFVVCSWARTACMPGKLLGLKKQEKQLNPLFQ